MDAEGSKRLYANRIGAAHAQVLFTRRSAIGTIERLRGCPTIEQKASDKCSYYLGWAWSHCNGCKGIRTGSHALPRASYWGCRSCCGGSIRLRLRCSADRQPRTSEPPSISACATAS